MRNALERRQEILSVLNVRRYEKIENLAFEFGVSRDTIERDIQELTLRYPIYTVQGGGGGVYVTEGCVAGRKYMSDRQSELLRRRSVSGAPIFAPRRNRARGGIRGCTLLAVKWNAACAERGTGGMLRAVMAFGFASNT